MGLRIRAARRRARRPVEPPATTGIPFLPATVVGLTLSDARARYRRRTAAMVGLLIVGWLLFFRLALNETVGHLGLVQAPRYTAVVERAAPWTDLAPLVLRWSRPDGTEGYGAVEP